MGGASARDVAAVLALAGDLAEVVEDELLVDEVLRGLLEVIDGEVTGFNRCNLLTREASVRIQPCEPVFVALSARVPATMDDHPVLQHLVRTGDPRPCRASDLLSQQEWRATGIFAEVLAPMGTPHFLVIPIAVGRWGADGYVITRGGSDFSDRDRSVAEVLQAALVALHHRLVPRRPPAPTIPRQSDAVGPGGPLTPREVEVLRLVARGCTAQAVSSSLCISPRTVRKHLEHIYDKLEAHDRLLAVDRARGLGLIAGSRSV